MEDRVLGSALTEWLQATDAPLPDAATNVHLAVERAARSRQRGRAGRPRRVQDDRRRVPGLRLPAVLAALTIGFALVALVVSMLLTSELESSLPSASAVTTADGLHWQTDLIDLRADAFRLEIGDKTYTTVGVPLRATSDTGSYGMPILRLDWTEHGDDLRLELVAAAGPYAADAGSPEGDAPDPDEEWWVDRIRVRSTADADAWLSYHGPLFVSSFGEVFQDDVALTLNGQEEATLQFDGLVLDVTAAPEPAWWQGAQILGLPIPGEIARFIPREWVVGPEPTPRPRSTPLPRVTVPYRDVALEGRLRDDDAIAVTGDLRGHGMRDVVDITIGPTEAVWVARPRSVFELGVDGTFKVPFEGPAPIEWIEAHDDGSLTVHGDGEWRLQGRTWTRLSDERAPIPTPPAVGPDAGLEADFIVEAVTSDGTTWGRSDDERSQLLVLPVEERVPLPNEVTGSATKGAATSVTAAGLGLVGEDVGHSVVRITDDGTGRPLTGLRYLAAGPDGAIWVSDRRAVHRLGDPGPATLEAGPQWIDRIVPTGGGTASVMGDGTWLLSDDGWLDLSAPVRGRMDTEGVLDGMSVVGITADGVWGARYDDDGMVLPYRWVDGRWVQAAVGEDVLSLVATDRLWVATGTSGGPGHDWLRWVQGEWQGLDREPASLVPDPEAEVLWSRPADGDSVWFVVGREPQRPEHIVRFADGRWTAHPTEAIASTAGVELQAWPEAALDGRFLRFRVGGWAPDVGDVLFDGDSVWLVPPLPPDFELSGLTIDGSVWGLGRDGSLLVMPQAATIAEVERNSATGPT